MTFQLTRVSKVPNSPMRILVDGPAAESDGDAGLGQGGSFLFMPAGQDGDRAQMSEHAARVILSDPDQAKHFTCLPALPVLTPAAEATSADAEAPREADGGKTPTARTK